MEDINMILNVGPHEVIIDEQDFKVLKDTQFCYSTQPNGRVYIQHWNKGKCSYIHRMIMRPAKGFVVDHINRNTLDNRRSNLRVCTQHENCCNQKMYSSNTTGYKGVVERKDGRRKKWRSEIRSDQKTQNLGSFYTIEEAARAYDRAALREFREFAILNFPDDIA